MVLDGKPGGFVLNRVVRAEILKTLNQRAPIAFKNAFIEFFRPIDEFFCRFEPKVAVPPKPLQFGL